MVRKHRAPKGALRLGNQHVRGELLHVRKHRAPKGALRLDERAVTLGKLLDVRKHRAPKGALRPLFDIGYTCHTFDGQKAPSAKRCIKTGQAGKLQALRRVESESTERQKVH